MSGGHFINSYEMYQILDDIEQLILSNDSTEQNVWGEDIGRHYDDEIILKFRLAHSALRQAAKMVTRIDYLVSCDDGPDAFKRRWEEEIV